MTPSLQTLEARLNAQREIVIALLSHALLERDTGLALLRSLEEEVIAQDGAEDPGSQPSAGFARGNEKSTEIRDILDTAKARAEAILSLQQQETKPIGAGQL